MKIECTVEELKELLKKEIPVAGTTDVVKIKIDETVDSLLDKLNQRLNNYF